MNVDEVILPYDIRGIYGENLTDELISLIAKAVGTIVSKKIVVGRDTRWSSPKVSEILISSLISTGCDVVDIGEVPNPVFFLHCFEEKLPGVYITASHNPKEYTGLKFARADGTSFVKELDDIKSLVRSKKFAEGNGEKKSYGNAIEDYVDFLSEKLKFDKKSRFIVDAYHACPSLVLKKLFDKVGLEAKILRGNILPDFGGIKPDPKPSEMGHLAEKIHGYDFAVGLDGDGDRCIFVDDQGNAYGGSRMLSLFSKFLVKRGEGVVGAFTCSESVQEIVESVGGKFYWSRTGHNYVVDELVKRGAILAGEESAHFYFSEIYPFSDGILAILMLCKILSMTGDSFSELMQTVPKKPIVKGTVDMENHEIKEKTMKIASDKFKKEYKCIEIDGVRFDYDGYAVLVRQSNTLPEIKINIEGETEEGCEEVLEKFSKIILKIRGGIK